MIWNLLKKLLCKRKQKSSIEDSISIGQLILNAKAGDAEAQYNLGICYETGNCIERDTEQALYWYQKSVDQGFALAKYALSKMYAEGNSVDKDLAKAIPMMQEAAEAGVTSAIYGMGMAYQYGRYVEPNSSEALRWYQLGAEKGDAACQCNLAALYIREGFEKKRDLAIQWMTKSAEQDWPLGVYNMGYIYDVLLEDTKNNKQLALEYYTKASNLGEPNAHFRLGLFYAQGNQVVQKDQTKAFNLFMIAAQQGITRAQTIVGIHYVNGYGVEKNWEEGFGWLIAAWKNGDDYAKTTLEELGYEFTTIEQNNNNETLP